jgi:WD40 repeat protein
VIGSVTDSGFVSIWDKACGSLLYQAKHHGKHQSVLGIKVSDEFVLTGGGDGSLIMLERVEGVWKITHEMFENKEGISHIVADGKWAVTGSRQSIKLWDLDEHKLVESVRPVEVKVCMLSFTYPHVFVVGGENWNGIQIWDLSKCELLRHVADDGKPFYNVHYNDHFLTVSEANIPWRGENDGMMSVAVYDALELADTKIETKNLWKKTFEFSPGADYEQINAVSNKTSLIVTHASTISILNFWKDRIIPSREFVPEEAIKDEEDWETEESFSEEDEEL